MIVILLDNLGYGATKTFGGVINMPTLERLAKRHRNKTIVAVSHADPIKAAVTYAQGVPLDLFQRTVISPCSLSAVAFSAGTPVVLCVNNTGSLKELSPS